MQSSAPPRWPRTIGIVGGLGPHAHIAFETQLLAAVGAVEREQDFPPWILSSLPATPDRTGALLGDGASPLPALVASLKNLEGRADFAVVVCNTAHAFLAEACRQVEIPVLHAIRETILEIAASFGAGASIGLLATTGTLRSGIYPETAAAVAPELRWRTPLDLPGGDELQEKLVMQSIFGRGQGGLKAGLQRDPCSDEPYAVPLARAARHLADDGCVAVVMGCTEIPLAFRDHEKPSSPHLVDPMQIAAVRCLQIAAGDAPLPEAGQ